MKPKSNKQGAKSLADQIPPVHPLGSEYIKRSYISDSGLLIYEYPNGNSIEVNYGNIPDSVKSSIGTAMNNFDFKGAHKIASLMGWRLPLKSEDGNHFEQRIPTVSELKSIAYGLLIEVAIEYQNNRGDTIYGSRFEVKRFGDNFRISYGLHAFSF